MEYRKKSREELCIACVEVFAHKHAHKSVCMNSQRRTSDLSKYENCVNRKRESNPNRVRKNSYGNPINRVIKNSCVIAVPAKVKP